MQTKKRNPEKNSSREHVRSRISRAQKKLSENVHVSESNVTQLITSARKKKSGTMLLKKKYDSFTVTDLDAGFVSLPLEETSLYLDSDPANIVSSDCKEGCNMGSENILETLFSPGFHTSKSVAVEIENGDLGGNSDSEVSAIYVGVKNSKLECDDEEDGDDMCIEEEADEEEEFDDFDPYLFIKNLPALSSVVPTFRPVLLPKQTRSCPLISLVLDLDETLVHSMVEACPNADFTFPVTHNCKEHMVYVKCRPHLKDFMEKVASLFEIIVFTASQSIYADQVLNVLDPKRRIFRHRVFRESCVFVEGNYLKDLSVLGRDLSRIAIIDNSPQAFGFQVDNGIPIESWYDDSCDEELVSLLPFLERLAHADDVRPLIATHFKLRQKVEAAT